MFIIEYALHVVRENYDPYGPKKKAKKIYKIYFFLSANYIQFILIAAIVILNSLLVIKFTLASTERTH